LVGVDLEDAVHLRRDDHDWLAERDRTSRETGTGTTRGERPVVSARDADTGLHLCGRQREAHDAGVAAGHYRRIVSVERQLEWLGADAIGSERVA
jgi:hypothetical protein